MVLNTTKCIASIPDISAGNPYQHLFYEELKKQTGIDYCNAVYNDIWLKQNIDTISAIHIHWPEDCWRYTGNTFFKGLIGLAGFLRYALILKKNNVKLIWTVHNMEHHEGIYVV